MVCLSTVVSDGLAGGRSKGDYLLLDAENSLISKSGSAIQCIQVMMRCLLLTHGIVVQTVHRQSVQCRTVGQVDEVE